jgi:multicopper oxidase
MVTRRHFLYLLGGAGATASAAGLVQLGRMSAASATPAVAEPRLFRLETRRVRWELAPGRTVGAMAYNGEVPGPVLRVREGERVRVELKNGLSEPTTVHWHGVDVPNGMDGVPELTQKPVGPGETFVYEFTAKPAGTRWYHTHFHEHQQMDLGLAAPLIIEPSGPEPLSYDRELTLVMDDWVSGVGPALPPTPAGTAGGRGQMGGMMSGRRMGGMMGRGGMMGGSKDDDPPYDTMTINGKAYPATEPLRLRKGERLRLRLINASNEHTHVFRVSGHALQVTHTDGNPLESAVDVDAIPMAPSERYDAVLQADRPGAWWLYCTEPGHAAAGEQMLLMYDNSVSQKPAPPETDVSGLKLWHYGMGRGRLTLPPPTGTTYTFDLTLSGGMMGSDRWTINNKMWPKTDPLPVARGDRAILRFRNMSPEAHPMHLHGQSFRVLAVNGARYATPIVKDSIDVEAHMGSAVVELTAHNPGDWLLHCHKPMHMDGGMVVLMKVA